MADKMLRIAGRGEDGLAKAVATDSEGNLNVNANTLSPLNRKYNTHTAIESSRLESRKRYLESELVLLDGEPNHGWTRFGTGNVISDTTYKESGQQSLKISTLDGGGTVYARKVGTYNLNNFDHFRFWVRKGQFAPKSFQIIFYSPTGENNFASPYFMNDLEKPMGDSYEISFSKADCTIVGTPNWTTVTEIYIQVSPFVGEFVDVWIDNFKAQKSIVTKGKVLLRFDDGDPSIYSTAKTPMENAGVPGNCVVIPQRVINGTAMSVEQMKELQTLGWDISGHSWGHMAFDTRTGHQGYNDLKATQNFLIENGFEKGARSHVFPGHLYNVDTHKAASQLYHINNSGVPRHETLPWGNPNNLNYVSGDAKSVAQLQAYVDKCAANKTLCIIMFHKIVAVTDAYSTDPAVFTTFINYLAGLNTVDVITYSDLIDGSWIATR